MSEPPSKPRKSEVGLKGRTKTRSKLNVAKSSPSIEITEGSVVGGGKSLKKKSKKKKKKKRVTPTEDENGTATTVVSRGGRDSKKIVDDGDEFHVENDKDYADDDDTEHDDDDDDDLEVRSDESLKYSISEMPGNRKYDRLTRMEKIGVILGATGIVVLAFVICIGSGIAVTKWREWKFVM